MEKSIEWNVKVGKKVFFENLKKPRRIRMIIISFVFLFLLIFNQVTTKEHNIFIEILISFSVLLLLFILIVVYFYIINKESFRDGIWNYRIDSSGIIMNGKFYPWSNYKYFLDDAKLVEKWSASGILPTALTTQPIDRWIIQLQIDKFSDKNMLILIMDNKNIYNKVREIVIDKLGESSSIS